MVTGTIDDQYIETHRSKKKNKIICPSCGGNDLGIIPGRKFCHCFECGDNYRIGNDDGEYREEFDNGIQFDTDAIRSMYSDAARYYHSCISKEHIEYLRVRGIDERAIDLFSIGFCPPSSAPFYKTTTAKLAGIADGQGNPWLANRVVFPYIAEGQVTDLRGRLIGLGDPKYKSLYHGSHKRGADYPFNYDRALQRAMETKLLILTEGEIKAVVADLQEFAIVALPGMLSYRPAFVPQPGIKIVVIYDNSIYTEDRIRIDHAIRKLAKRIPEFSVVTLPLLDEPKMDVDSYLLHARGGASRLTYYVRNALPYPLYSKLRAF